MFRKYNPEAVAALTAEQLDFLVGIDSLGVAVKELKKQASNEASAKLQALQNIGIDTEKTYLLGRENVLQQAIIKHRTSLIEKILDHITETGAGKALLEKTFSVELLSYSSALEMYLNYNHTDLTIVRKFIAAGATLGDDPRTILSKSEDNLEALDFLLSQLTPEGSAEQVTFLSNRAANSGNIKLMKFALSKGATLEGWHLKTLFRMIVIHEEYQDPEALLEGAHEVLKQLGVSRAEALQLKEIKLSGCWREGAWDSSMASVQNCLQAYADALDTDVTPDLEAIGAAGPQGEAES